MADVIIRWDINNKLSDEEYEDTMQLIDNISAPISHQLSDESNNKDSDKDERYIGLERRDFGSRDDGTS